MKTMSGPPMSIGLVSVYKPFALSNARPIPIAWRDPVKNILEDMVTQCIIARSPNPQNRHTPSSSSPNATAHP